MYTRTRRSEHVQGGGTALFEGEPYGSGVTFFWVDNAPGQGPPLHRHPYSETWAVIAGTVSITIDGEELQAAEGDIVVVGPNSPHKFRATGRGVHMMCIHASPRLIEEELAE